MVLILVLVQVSPNLARGPGPRLRPGVASGIDRGVNPNNAHSHGYVPGISVGPGFCHGLNLGQGLSNKTDGVSNRRRKGL